MEEYSLTRMTILFTLNFGAVAFIASLSVTTNDMLNAGQVRCKLDYKSMMFMKQHEFSNFSYIKEMIACKCTVLRRNPGFFFQTCK